MHTTGSDARHRRHPRRTTAIVIALVAAMALTGMHTSSSSARAAGRVDLTTVGRSPLGDLLSTTLGDTLAALTGRASTSSADGQSVGTQLGQTLAGLLGGAGTTEPEPAPEPAPPAEDEPASAAPAPPTASPDEPTSEVQPDPTPPPSSAQAVGAQGEALGGNATPILDVAASEGKAARLDGPVAVDVQPGSYRVTMRLRGGGELAVRHGDERLAHVPTGLGYDTTSFPAQMAGDPIVLVPAGKVVIDWIQLTPSEVDYTTRGRDILRPDGTAWIPKGVNRDGFAHTANGFNVDYRELDHMVRWGVDSVRLPMFQDFVVDGCHHDPTYLGKVGDYVDEATSRGIFVILDLHFRSTVWCGWGTPAPMADDQSVQFWHRVATEFKDNPLVGFDVYNEPHDISDGEWRYGRRSLAGNYAGMEQLIRAVRDTGADNLIFVTGNVWGNDLNPAMDVPLSSYNIVLAAHAYHFGETQMAQWIKDNVRVAEDEYPIVITEFGTDLYSRSYLDDVISWADAHRFGWLAWKWYAGDQFSLLSSMTTYEPSVQGAAVWDGLATRR